MSLALGKTLQELRQMPVSDLAIYEAYYQEQPFGQWRADYNAALIARSMAGGSLRDLMAFWFDRDDVGSEEVALEILAGSAITI